MLYLQQEQIERDAAVLLTEYEQARRVQIDRVVPIEGIIEKHLKLGIEFEYMNELFGVSRSGLKPDFFGCISFAGRRIVIDESLDPKENPWKEDRYRFTLVHKGGGHWRLHRPLFAIGPKQVSLANEPASAEMVCRSSQARERIE